MSPEFRWEAVGLLGELDLDQMLAPLPVLLDHCLKVDRLVRIIKHEYVRRRTQLLTGAIMRPIDHSAVLARHPIST